MPGPFTGALASILSGEKVNGTDTGNWHDILDALTGAWTSYTPTWTASITPPVLNNGTLTGRYAQIGKLVFFSIELTVGSTSTVGAGAYSLSLPVTAVASGIPQVVAALIQDTSATTTGHFPAAGVIGSGASTCSFNNVNQAVTAAFPQNPWATGDLLIVSGTYEAA